MFDTAKKMKKLLLFILLFTVYSVFSQDSVKVNNILNQSIEALRKSELKNSIQFARQALQICNQGN